MASLPDSKVHGAKMGPIWFLSAPGGPHVGLTKIAIWGFLFFSLIKLIVVDDFAVARKKSAPKGLKIRKIQFVGIEQHDM